MPLYLWHANMDESNCLISYSGRKALLVLAKIIEVIKVVTVSEEVTEHEKEKGFSERSVLVSTDIGP